MQIDGTITMHILIIVALWRGANLLVNERGIFGIFEKLRVLFGEVQYDEMSREKYPNEFAHLFSCVWCMSVWLALPVGFFVQWDSTYKGVFEGFVLGLAYSGAIVILDRYIRSIR